MKLRYDGPLSNLAFNFNLRRYTVVAKTTARLQNIDGVYKVGRCRLSISKPVLKALMVSEHEIKCDALHSNFALIFNLRRYNKDPSAELYELTGRRKYVLSADGGKQRESVQTSKVGWCRSAL